MEKLWEFYENLNEIVYVSDLDNYELIYMNRRAREIYEVNAMEEIKGKKCYEVLQGCQKPCAMCNNKRLKAGCFVETTHYNPALGRMYGLKDTMIEGDGRRYRLELAFDMGNPEQKITIKEAEFDSEALINEGMRISLSVSDPGQSIEILLEYLGQSLSSERVYIFEEKSKGIYANTYEWCASGVVPQKEMLQNVPFEVVKLWYQRFRNRENIIIPDVESIREKDPAVYEYLVPQNIQSLIVNPLMNEGQIIGFFGVDNPPSELLTHISGTFQTISYFIASLLKRRKLVKHLEELSFYDQLTQLGNRHAMHSYILTMQDGQSIGILYCDVMGLKKVNDAEGHQAGDNLLIRASECLKREFKDYDLFRIGGDEFLVLCAGIAQKELLEKVEELKKDMKEKKALMAIGCVWRSDSREDMDQLLAEADDRMYEDKRGYYMKN